jgi:hypothetical protein
MAWKQGIIPKGNKRKGENMKNMADIESRLRVELTHWFPIQCRNEFKDFFLWYQETTKEHDGGILIAGEEKPANPEIKKSVMVRKDFTIDQNLRMLADVCRTLPVLEY